MYYVAIRKFEINGASEREMNSLNAYRLFWETSTTHFDNEKFLLANKLTTVASDRIASSFFVIGPITAASVNADRKTCSSHFTGELFSADYKMNTSTE